MKPYDRFRVNVSDKGVQEAVLDAAAKATYRQYFVYISPGEEWEVLPERDKERFRTEAQNILAAYHQRKYPRSGDQF